MMALCGDSHFCVGIEDHNVGVGANCDGPFARKQAEQLCRRSRCELNEAVQTDSSTGYAPVVDQAHTMLDSRSAVWDLREVVASQLFLLLEAERAVIG